MEADWVVSMLLNDYYKFLDWERSYKNSSDKAISTLRDLSTNKANAKKILQVLHDYELTVKANFLDQTLPVVVVSGLGHSDPVNQPVRWIYDYFLTYLISEGFRVIQLPHRSPYLEINAAVDMKALIHSENFTGDQASSFTRNIARMRSSQGLQSFLPFCSLSGSACNPNW